jgi:formate/nitrite transporter FocA (FNT family)
LTRFAHEVAAAPPLQTFAEGIGGGWLIAALVWILAATEGSDFLIITLLTYFVALLGFRHIVADTAEALYGWFKSEISFNDLAFAYFFPTLAGNVFGGTVLFSLLSYAQVREEIFLESKR